MSPRTRSARVTTAVYAAVTVLAAVAMALSSSIATSAETAGVAAVPAQGTSRPTDGSVGAADAQRVDRPAASLLSCHRWPNGAITQTYDPQSPACVSTWDYAKGNGGATAVGVDEASIRIGVSATSPELDRLAAFANANYQFYGRSLKFVPIGSLDSVEAQKAAVATAKERQVFAVIDTEPLGNTFPVDADAWVSDLAKQKIIAIAADNVVRNSSLVDNGPYAWSVAPTWETRSNNLAQVICRAFKGRPAGLLGPDSPARKFAVVAHDKAVLTARDLPRPPEPLIKALRSCDIDAPVYELQSQRRDPVTSAKDQQTFKMMRESGITSTIFLPDVTILNEMSAADATAAQFTSEWLLAHSSAETLLGSAPKPQSSATVGLFYGNFEPSVSTPVALAPYDLARHPNPAMADGGAAKVTYRSVALLAAGIQAAGPKLTPETFAAGLQATHFPNPLLGQQLSYSFPASFAAGDHVFEHGFALSRWQSYDLRASGKRSKETVGLGGHLCLGDGGRRYGYADDWPTDDQTFVRMTPHCATPLQLTK